MSNPITKALDEALDDTSTSVDPELLQSVIKLQQRRQYDDDSERRIQELERLILQWCDESKGS